MHIPSKHYLEALLREYQLPPPCTMGVDALVEEPLLDRAIRLGLLKDRDVCAKDLQPSPLMKVSLYLDCTL